MTSVGYGEDATSARACCSGESTCDAGRHAFMNACGPSGAGHNSCPRQQLPSCTLVPCTGQITRPHTLCIGAPNNAGNALRICK